MSRINLPEPNFTVPASYCQHMPVRMKCNTPNRLIIGSYHTRLIDTLTWPRQRRWWRRVCECVEQLSITQAPDLNGVIFFGCCQQLSIRTERQADNLGFGSLNQGLAALSITDVPQGYGFIVGIARAKAR